MAVLPVTFKDGDVLSVNDYQDMELFIKGIPMFSMPHPLTRPTLFLFTRELRFVIMGEGDGSDMESQQILDSRTENPDHLHPAQNSGYDFELHNVGLNDIIQFKFSSEFKQLPVYENCYKLMYEGDPSRYQVVYDTDGATVLDVTHIIDPDVDPEHIAYPDFVGFFDDFCAHNEYFELYLQKHPSYTPEDYLNSVYGMHDMLWEALNHPTTAKGKAERLVRYNSMVDGPDWQAGQGQAGYIKNKPNVGDFGGTTTFCLTENQIASANTNLTFLGANYRSRGGSNGANVPGNTGDHVLLPAKSGLYRLTLEMLSESIPSSAWAKFQLCSDEQGTSKHMDKICGLCGGSSNKSYPNSTTVIIDTKYASDDIKVYLRCVESSGSIGVLGGSYPIINTNIMVERVNFRE